MVTTIRTDSTDKHFILLVSALDTELREVDGPENLFYSKFSKIDALKYCLVAFEADKAIACGALRWYKDHAIEIKRMYTLKKYRGRGTASQILHELEQWARELNARECILETGKRQEAAQRLYRSMGFRIIDNYGPYKDVSNSICYSKKL